MATNKTQIDAVYGEGTERHGGKEWQRAGACTCVCMKVVREKRVDRVHAWLVYFSSNVLVATLLHRNEAAGGGSGVCVCVCLGVTPLFK